MKDKNRSKSLIIDSAPNLHLKLKLLRELTGNHAYHYPRTLVFFIYLSYKISTCVGRDFATSFFFSFHCTRATCFHVLHDVVQRFINFRRCGTK